MSPEIIDLDRYLPFKTLASIESFCGNDDGMLSNRKHALLRRIKAVANVSKDVSKFNGGLCRILFDPDFIIRHKWPVKKLVINNYNNHPKINVKINFFSPNKHFAKKFASALPPVPPVFVSLLESTLQKLADLDMVDKEFVGTKLFIKMRVKFSNESKKVITKQKNYFLLRILIFKPRPLHYNACQIWKRFKIVTNRKFSLRILIFKQTTPIYYAASKNGNVF